LTGSLGTIFLALCVGQLSLLINVFSIQLLASQECLHGSATLAVLSLVSSLGVISVHESVKVVLQILHRPVETFSEGDRIELLLNRLVKLFRHAIGLRMTGFGPRVLNVIEVQEKLIGMGLRNSTVLGAEMDPTFWTSDIVR
jgi:hypothetical protein